MGFDWRAFAEGFATTAAANIQEKKKEAPLDATAQ